MNCLNFRPKILLLLSMTMGIFILPSIAQAIGIVGGSLIVQNDGEVTATFGGSFAGYNPYPLPSWRKWARQ